VANTFDHQVTRSTILITHYQLPKMKSLLLRIMGNSILLQRGKNILLALLSTLLFLNHIQAQLTINVTSIPATTPPNDIIYIAGNFNNWNPGDTSYRLTDRHDGTWFITFSPAP